MKPISIIILANCDASTLKHTLPELLAQQYEPDYEVIVVRDAKKGEINDLLEALMIQYSKLRTTFLPDRPQYVTDYEVEIMLGVKAAKNDSIVIVSSEFIAPSDEWLTSVGDIIGEGTTLLVGSAPYTNSTSFLKKYNHKKRFNKVLRRWSKTCGNRKEDFMLPKNKRSILNIAFSANAYINDSQLRELIFIHEDV